jgi:methionine biosynthesis protein MetW
MTIRSDLSVVADMVTPSARVLDVGCGDGVLLRYLSTHKNIDGRGIELSQAGVNSCVAQGLSVVQGDADSDLKDYPTGGFDFAILSQTLQATQRPRQVLDDLLRIGRRAIVSFPNFGHWRVRLNLVVNGTMPETQRLPDPWYQTSNIHLCTIRDFINLCAKDGIKIERALWVGSSGQPRVFSGQSNRANLLGEQGVFLLSRSSPVSSRP